MPDRFDIATESGASAISTRSRVANNFATMHMQSLTNLAKFMLPAGIWNDTTSSGIENDRNIYLTFDDGPNPATTPGLMELFEEEGVKATFFVIGNQVEKHEDLLKLVSDSGHSIGNHTYSHPFLPALSQRKMEVEILSTNQRIKDITGRAPKLFRPPFGIADAKAQRLLKEQNMDIVYWSAFSEDWRKIGVESVVSRLAKHAMPGAIMILHELEPTGKQTIAAARTLIQQLKKQNYTFKALAT
ncbi:MAG: polysaccharide deacetylase family protein [Leptolyngbya sp.]|nr:polysaccharide deacetylase family protein [Candidatus Melainabacteria bacterium]